MARVQINIDLSCCLVLLLLNIIISMENCHAQFTTEKQHKALFVFGDSLYDPGNNIYLKSRSSSSSSSSKQTTAHMPYGETYFKHPTGRFSDGRIVPDFIATFAILPILSPYLQPHPTPFADGANFASGGAGVTTGLNPSIMLPIQLSHFKEVVESLKQELGDVRAQSVLENAVYLFSVGGNDYIAFHTQNSNTTDESYKRAYVYQVVSNLTSVFKEVYSLGGRKFGYQSVGPLGCTPVSRVVSSGDCDPDLMEMARQHNQAFSIALNKLESELSGFRYSLFDYYNALNDRIENPLKYGLKEGKVACCGVGPFRRTGCGVAESFELCKNPDEHVWFDSAHPVEEVNSQMATLIWSGPPNVTGPYNVKQFFGY